MKNFSGKVLFLDRNDINTDEIIPAKYLTEITKDALKAHLLEDLIMEGFDPHSDIKDNSIIITRGNFGCGSSREHAPWALEVNDINLVIGESFARIFRQNMYNCGMMAIELAPNIIEKLFDSYSAKDIEIKTDFDGQQFSIIENGVESEKISFELADYDRELVTAGGWVDYADSRY